MKRILATLMAVALLSIGVPVAAHAAPLAETALYVSPSGSDSGSGTLEDPLLTLEGARDAIRELGGAGALPAGGVTVYLREGTYPRTSSFELGAQDSGTADSPITYRSYPGETARLSGGVELERSGFAPVTDDAMLSRIIDDSAHGRVLQFDLAAHGITDYGAVSRHGYWKANDVSDVPPMQLYVAGEGMTLARWPNNGTVQMGEIIDVGPTVKDADLQERGGTFSYAYDRPQYWTEAEDVWLDGIFGYSWEWSYNRIESIDTAAKTITLAYGEMSGLMKTWFEDFHFAENLLEELDAPAEYYIDRESGILYFLPNAAFETTEAPVTVTMLDEPMIRTDGASHVLFDELVLEYGRATAAVILGGSNVQIAHSDIQNFTDGGVYINSPGRYTYDGIPVNRGGVDHAVVSSHLRHIGGVGVVLQGGDKDTLARGDNRAENSHIHDFAYYHKAYNPGVMLDGVGNIARGNEIHDAPHPGLIVHGNDHLIEYNEIYDICKTFQDLGAIYMNAGATPQQRGTEISRNYFHDTGIGRLGVEGIYPDNLTMGLTIEENVFYRMGNDAIKNGSGDRIDARNNVFVDTHIPYDNYEMWMGDQPGNKVDTDYMPKWIELFEANNGFVDTPYGERYPELLTFFDENHYYPENNHFERNVVWNPGLSRAGDVNEHGARDVHGLLNYADNWVADQDPGFVDWRAGDFRFAEDAAVFDRIPGFTAVPFDQMGTQGVIGHPITPAHIAVDAVHLPSEQLVVELGDTVSFAAEVVPWNASNAAVTYASSDPAVASVDAAGQITALAPGQAVVTATSVADAAITDEATVVVLDGDGVLHFTDFESGGNGWPVDGNRSIVKDADGDHWYHILGGANGQLPRDFGEYVLEFEVRTPAEVPEGGVLLVYDRSGATPGGYVRYQHLATGPKWTIYDSAWATVEEVVLPAASGFTPDTVYGIRMVVSRSGIQVSVDGEVVIEGTNPAPDAAGKVGFYVEKFAYLDVDDVTISLVPVDVSGISLSPGELLLATGERGVIAATVTPAEASNAGVDWSTSDPGVATVGTDGTVRGVAAGTATITATSQADPGISAAATVQVQDVDYPVIELGDQLSDAANWTGSGAVDFEEGTIGISGEGVVGYSGETFGDGLLRFSSEVDGFDGGWFGFAVRSDRAGDPAWVGGNKGYLVVIKEDVIEVQSWKPGQTMMDVIPNTAVLAGTEHTIEFGAVAAAEAAPAAAAAAAAGTQVALRVDGRTIWSAVDMDAASPIADAGYLNVYHYAEQNALRLKPAAAEEPVVTGIAAGAGEFKEVYRVGDELDVSGMTLAVSWSDDSTSEVPVTPAMVSGFDSTAPAERQELVVTYAGFTATFVIAVIPAADPGEDPGAGPAPGDGASGDGSGDLASTGGGGAWAIAAMLAAGLLIAGAVFAVTGARRRRVGSAHPVRD